METVIFFSGIAFIAGIIVGSMLITRLQPRIVYVQTEPTTHEGGCFPLFLFGIVAVVLLLVAIGM